MRSHWLPWLLAGAIAVAGCGGGPSASGGTPAVRRADEPFVPTGEAKERRDPDPYRRTRIAMLRQNERLTVGMSQEDALALFPEPRRSYALNDVPPGFGDGYRARGWESRLESFGILLFNDRLVFAMRQFEDMEEPQYEDLVREYETALRETESTFVAGRHVRYQFWQDGTQRLMVLAVQRPKDRLNVTVSMGDNVVMDRLRMSESHARDDANRADLRIDESLKTNLPPPKR